MKDAFGSVRVLELASWTFVPAAGAVLADWGADVIKVEHPVTGDPQRGLMTMGIVGARGQSGAPQANIMVEQPNRGKRSVGLDIRTDAGRELLYRLAETSDVFLTNFLSQTRRRLQVDVEHLRARNPKIIYVRGTGHGSRGREADKGGFDGSAWWARGGIGYAITPPEDTWPIMQRPAFGDLPGGIAIAGGIAAALFRRERTGVPSVVDVSLLGCAVWQLSPDILSSKLSGESPFTAALSHEEPPNPIVNRYRTSDGRAIQLAMLESDRFWSGFCVAIGRPDLADDPRFVDSGKRFENRRACVEALDEVFATRPLAEWRKILDSQDGVWAAYQTPRELHDDPQVVDNCYLREVKAEGGAPPFTLAANPIQFDETPAELCRAPEHGEHTEQVLLELGLTWAEIGRHKEAGAIL